MAFGDYSLTVSSVEAIAADSQHTGLVVFYRWVRTVTADDQRQRGIRFPLRFAMTDDQGESYGPGHRLDATTYRRLEAAAQGWKEEESLELKGAPEDWVVLFRAPRERRGFILLVDNPDRREGQPCGVSVALGR